jgi:hypothetical protein
MLFTKCYTKYQEMINEGIVEIDISNLFGKMQVSPLKKKRMPCSAAQI